MAEQVIEEPWADCEWEEEGILMAPVVGSRSTRMVTFSVAEMQVVYDAAERAGVSTSAFIRQAALDLARSHASSSAPVPVA